MAKFELDTEFVRKLAAILEETKLGEIELADGERRIRVVRPAAPVAQAAPVMMAAAPATVPATAVPAAGDLSKHPGVVKSPMVGTAYLAPEPGKPNFVAVGDKVIAGQTLLIIEAMKTFNPIKAPKGGTVTQILIENALPVEFGEPLMIVE
ncbi:acetyl-CoA carboxylase biotin carboxyl carrier protein subunit [Reyranella sp.]|jgi:acetyl-CoA carboxylase biotin carboxyl carrier protein|uniref:acetyl-CoA carboxylase biotin carboxyl carrier protein n=1 Tax=Reyranella sp. TaxID=1929291 RepID=UPI000BDBD791|nr:acetyl-CoA carboxylase biotin carboxyl carrier protein subunit [Reyranella sp.]OYY41994.1 MAG: acetyl-CoA carboxylase biotin carboxyl carrier protein subunit [Rhodospirillales bacterium 35-66-84]OYZ93775.1 MAG: acetyl-CoA carboxylase biotin carboxyl carrier protein subunit [Rhodospirillales bacterium 24-66-33]OZB25025.1 MAG: acetyl-CoA carboxylase biotin carboxyl carrier protein subunit [Rhodospirillales bacterium 39-66-50]HQS17870.1 acetyl-CoA carboxylase biotin carboxyl carrier protein sub